MVMYLILTIISSTGLLIILKSFYYWKVNTLHGIIFNYWTATTLSFLIAPSSIINNLHQLNDLWYVAGTIGFLFIIVFYITGRTTQQLGVGVASVASKMSMVIPIAAGLILYNETMGLQKMSGILLAIPAVILVSRPSVKQEGVQFRWSEIWLPVLLFLGAGLVDTAIKFAQFTYMNEDNTQLVIMSIFASAGIIGIIILLYEVLFQKKKLLWRSVVGGLLLGTTNYLSLFFLLKCLEDPASESSTVFAYVNIGVVITSFLTGLILFSEKAEKNKIIGVVLSLIAIAVLSY
ncbi:MAG: EamA/RhaT family transporter [Bacteroidota bacterium]|nr:EamA/RhaT family transporter [Bacteroidota bacterium]